VRFGSHHAAATGVAAGAAAAATSASKSPKCFKSPRSSSHGGGSGSSQPSAVSQEQAPFSTAASSAARAAAAREAGAAVLAAAQPRSRPVIAFGSRVEAPLSPAAPLVGMTNISSSSAATQKLLGDSATASQAVAPQHRQQQHGAAASQLPTFVDPSPAVGRSAAAAASSLRQMRTRSTSTRLANLAAVRRQRGVAAGDGTAAVRIAARAVAAPLSLVEGLTEQDVRDVLLDVLAEVMMGAEQSEEPAHLAAHQPLPTWQQQQQHHSAVRQAPARVRRFEAMSELTQLPVVRHPTSGKAQSSWQQPERQQQQQQEPQQREDAATFNPSAPTTATAPTSSQQDASEEVLRILVEEVMDELIRSQALSTGGDETSPGQQRGSGSGGVKVLTVMQRGSLQQVVVDELATALEGWLQQQHRIGKGVPQPTGQQQQCAGNADVHADGSKTLVQALTEALVRDSGLLPPSGLQQQPQPQDAGAWQVQDGNKSSSRSADRRSAAKQSFGSLPGLRRRAPTASLTRQASSGGPSAPASAVRFMDAALSPLRLSAVQRDADAGPRSTNQAEVGLQVAVQSLGRSAIHQLAAALEGASGGAAADAQQQQQQQQTYVLLPLSMLSQLQEQPQTGAAIQLNIPQQQHASGGMQSPPGRVTRAVTAAPAPRHSSDYLVSSGLPGLDAFRDSLEQISEGSEEDPLLKMKGWMRSETEVRCVGVLGFNGDGMRSRG